VKKTSALVLAVTILLAGCGGGAKPDPSPSSTTGSLTTATTNATPTTPAPTTTAFATTNVPKIDPNIPAAARAHTPAGAEAFVKYFIQRSNEAWTGPHAGILAPLCQASAIACTGLERDATRLAKEGHHYDGDPVTIQFIGVLDATNPENYVVLANLVQEPRNEVDTAGKVYVTDQRKNVRLSFRLL